MDADVLRDELLDLAEQLADAEAAPDRAAAIIENVRRQLEDLANDVRQGAPR